jgi:hypothetical protein
MYLCTCFGTLDRRNDITTNVFLYYRLCEGHIYASNLSPGMQNKISCALSEANKAPS